MVPSGGYQREFLITGGDMASAGSVSTAIMRLLKEIGVPQDLVRRASISCYEAEMNATLYAEKCQLLFQINQDSVQFFFNDEGPGIEDIDVAMQEGYSTASKEIREMGFGAGMGLPNIRRNSDWMRLTSKVGEGTRLHFALYICNE